MPAQDPADDVAATPLIARLACRVKEARKARGWPRRVLSEKSGVSPRYLAQLEAGEGNISLAVLQRVAKAFDLHVETLLAQDLTWSEDVQRVAGLYRGAAPEIQSKVRALLAPQNPEALRTGRICLIGLRGAGKSTLGRMAGKALGLPFVELNREIEAESGMPLAEVMALYGQDGYRTLESQALARVMARHERLILAVAGGIVSEPQTYGQLLEQFHTIWVRTSAAEHMQRVREQGDLRPMEGNPAAMAQLKGLLEARTPLYAAASAQIDTSNKMISASFNDLMAVIATRKFLSSPSL